MTDLHQTTFQAFRFKNYSFDPNTKSLSLTYRFDDEYTFTETYTFDFDHVKFDSSVLDRACQNLFFMAGVSYYKAFLVKEIKIEAGQIDQPTTEFFAKTYQKGLGEYFYVNRMNPRAKIPFKSNAEKLTPVQTANNQGMLIAIGGGKDSLVSVEMARDKFDVTTWSVGHRKQLTPLIERIALPHCWVERQIDPKIIELKEQGALNGHIPISAIFACVGTIVAILTGKKDVVVSNENSSNEPTLIYDGVSINHQYSKSLEFEKDYQALLNHQFGSSLRYYSLLRSFSEVKIAEMFSENSFAKYQDVFSSCNRAFIQGNDKISWCGECPKCAFTYLAFSNFVDEAELIKLWGKNLLHDPNLEITYKNLLGISGDKPLDCVGEVKESRFAMQLAQRRDPKLSKFKFDIPEGFDYHKLAPHSIPEDITKIIL